MSKSAQTLLNEVPFRGTGTPKPPTDPLIYRFYELIMFNGPALNLLGGVGISVKVVLLVAFFPIQAFQCVPNLRLKNGSFS